MSRYHTFAWLTLGALIAVVANTAIAGIVNKVLTPLGLTYA